MGIYPIKDEAAHTRALRRIEALMDAESLTPEQGHELDALATLVEAYEEKNFAIKEASPIAVIEFMMDQRGLSRKDLQPMIGSRARVSEVLSGKRPLTLAMIRALSNAWSISGDLLLGETVRQKHRRAGRAKDSSRKVPTRSAGRMKKAVAA
jgi:HTH-type transcriptional regulator/antitoxin HigA